MTSYPQRKSPRLQGFDYSQDGAYFVTICTHERRHLFGSISDGRVIFSPLGMIAHQSLQDLPSYWPAIDLDSFVVMPNHIHAILFISDNVTKLDKEAVVPTVGQILGNYKGGVTRQARQQSIGESQVWQGRYHDHIIRNEHALNTIRAYVLTNPERWQDDTFYTANT